MSKRWIAYKVNVKDLVTGQYTQEGGILYKDHEINRARILGSVVSKFIGPEDKYAFIIIDDGTETIRVRSFEDTVPIIKDVQIGDIVDVIGRIRKYEDEVYIIPEIISKVIDPNWEILRKVELIEQEKQIVKAPVEESVVEKNEESEEEIIESSESPRKKIITEITYMDKGEGVDIAYLMDKLGFDRDTVESILNELMNDGTIFEPRAGKVKILE